VTDASAEPIVVNGRFFRAKPTGLHRVARELLAAATEAGLAVEIRKPPGLGADEDARGSGLSRRLGDQAWEQTTLPRLARGRRVLSLTNTAPIACRRSVVMVHDLAPLVGPQWFTAEMRGYARLVITAARRAELVLTVSKQVADELRERDVTAPIRVIRQAVDGIDATPASKVAASLQRLGVRPPYLLMLGSAQGCRDRARRPSAGAAVAAAPTRPGRACPSGVRSSQAATGRGFVAITRIRDR